MITRRPALALVLCAFAGGAPLRAQESPARPPDVLHSAYDGLLFLYGVLDDLARDAGPVHFTGAYTNAHYGRLAAAGQAAAATGARVVEVRAFAARNVPACGDRTSYLRLDVDLELRGREATVRELYAALSRKLAEQREVIEFQPPALRPTRDGVFEALAVSLDVLLPLDRPALVFDGDTVPMEPERLFRRAAMLDGIDIGRVLVRPHESLAWRVEPVTRAHRFARLFNYLHALHYADSGLGITSIVIEPSNAQGTLWDFELEISRVR